MSSTLIALLQSTLLQQQVQQTDDAAPEKEALTVMPPPGFEKRVSPAVTTLARPAAAGEGSGLVVNMPSLLKELVEVAAEVARTDGLLEEAEQSSPQGADAQKWHEVSCRALRWSRDALIDRQSNILVRMKGLVQESGARPGVVPAEPVLTPTSKCSWLNVDAPEFCPALKQSAAAQDREQHAAPAAGLPGAEHVGSLREDLEKLHGYDRRCCILVRKIKQLGLNSPETLHEHFSSYGELAEVLVSHTFEKPSAKRAAGRVRPAALGFVVLRSSEAAEAILAAGEEHVVGSGADAVTVLVQRYEPSGSELGREA